MTHAPPESLRRHLLWRLGTLVSIVLLLGAATTFILARHFAYGVFDQWLFDSASTLATQIKATTGQARVDLPRSALEMFEFDAVDRVFYDVVTPEGERIFGNAALPAMHGLAPGSDPVFYDAAIQGKAVRVVAIGLRGPGEASQPKSEAVVVQVAETINKRNALVAQILLSTLAPLIVLLVLAALGIWYAVTTGMKSLDDIVGRLAGYQPEHPAPLPAAQAVPVEIRPLLLALHALVGKLAEARASQQRFIVNASHQLRTPLAALQVQAERALREPDPVKHLAALESVLKTMNRLRHLSHQLLMLARAEPVGNPALSLRPTDLALLARDELEHWTDAAIAQGADLGYEGPASGVTINGEPQLLHELIGNLVDNAIRYGGAAARITLVLRADPQPELLIDDDGPGIPETERALVLERFYRRSQSPGEGTGLGLAIAREIAGRHGADLRIESMPDGHGTRIAVKFPCADRPRAQRSGATGSVQPTRPLRER